MPLLTIMDIVDWGLTHYADALARQKNYVERRIKNEVPDALFFTEHFSVYTIGRRMQAMQHLMISVKACEKKGIAVLETNRGGDITYHTPGQLVIYPVVNWGMQRDLHLYLRLLESVIINGLQLLGVKADRRDKKTGIWVGNHKIAAIGIAAKQWVLYHGVAININNDLSGFSDIIPCGIHPEEGGVTSLQLLLNRPLDMNWVKNAFRLEFCKIFGQE
jgi:lipoyl(octanoyl) transferase